MEVQIKKAIKAGNSSAVILPRSWLNKEIRAEIVKKTPEIILLDVIQILREHIDLQTVIGIYLTGSYAREEESPDSDIDILVITSNIDMEMIKEGIYNILLVSKELLKQKSEQDLLPVGQMIKEAKPLLNFDYLDSIKIKVTKRNIRWYVNTTENKLKIVKEIIDIAKKKNMKHLHNSVAYTLVLRIRTLYIINKLIKNENYMKNNFIKLIKDISKGTNAYEKYLTIKNNQEDGEGITLEETEALYKYLKNQLAGIKKTRL